MSKNLITDYCKLSLKKQKIIFKDEYLKNLYSNYDSQKLQSRAHRIIK